MVQLGVFQYVAFVNFISVYHGLKNTGKFLIAIEPSN